MADSRTIGTGMEAAITILAVIVLLVVVHGIATRSWRPAEPREELPFRHAGFSVEGVATGRRFGEVLRDARVSRGLSQRDVAKLVQISRARYQRIESGVVTPPDDELLLGRIASSLDVELELLCKLRRMERADALQRPTVMTGFQQAVKDVPILDVIRALQRALEEVGTAKERERFNEQAVQPVLKLQQGGLARVANSDVAMTGFVAHVTKFMPPHKRRRVFENAIHRLTYDVHLDANASDRQSELRPTQLLLDFATEVSPPFLDQADVEDAASGLLFSRSGRKREGSSLPIDVLRLIENHPRLTLVPLEPYDCWTDNGCPFLGRAVWAPDGSQIIINISKALLSARDDGTRRACRFTLAHELGHAALHLLRMSPGSVPRMLEEERKWIEWQANCFGASVLIPSTIVFRSLYETYKRPIVRASSWKSWISKVNRTPVMLGGVRFESMIEMFDVNPTPLMIRLRNLLLPDDATARNRRAGGNVSTAGIQG